MINTKRLILYVLTAFLFFFLFNLKPSATLVENKEIFSNAEIVNVVRPAEECESFLGETTDKNAPAYWIQWCLNVLKYVAIGALLLYTTMDFFKALVQNDKDALKKAGTVAVKRFVYCVLIFLLPIIVEFIMTLFGAYGTCGIG